MIQTIRPLEERLKTNVYNQAEFRMILEKMAEIEKRVEPTFHIILQNMFIKDADKLVNGASN